MRARDLLERIEPNQRLLLRSVLCDAGPAGEAFAEWRSRVDIDRLDPEANRLLPLLARRLDDIAPDDPVRGLVRGVYRHAFVRNQLILRDATSLAAALRDRGVPVLVLKGAALFPHYGNDWGRRPMFDVDLLVPARQLDIALGVLDSLGFRPRHGVSAAWLRTRVVGRRHSFPLSRDVDQQLDLHWHVLGGSLGPHADDDFWANAVPFDLHGVDVLALSPSDLLLHVVAHGTRSRERGYLQWIADTVHVARSADTAALADRLADQARRHGLVTTVRAALETIEQTVDEPQLRPLLDRSASTRPRILERVASAADGATPGLARRAVGELLRQGGGEVGVLGRTRGLVHAWLQLDLTPRPILYATYVATGCRARVAGIIRRVSGPLVRTPLRAAGAYAFGQELHFSAPTTCDHYAGPGWSAVTESGLRSHGREARLVVNLPDSGGDVDLDLTVCSDDGTSRRVELRVNERVVARVEVAPGHRDVRVRVPATVARRFRPMELALLPAPSAWFHLRGRVGVRLLRMRLRPSGPSGS